MLFTLGWLDSVALLDNAVANILNKNMNISYKHMAAISWLNIKDYEFKGSKLPPYAILDPSVISAAKL